MLVVDWQLVGCTYLFNVLVGLVSFIGLGISFIGGFVGLGLISLSGFSGISGLVGRISLSGRIGLDGITSLVGNNGLCWVEITRHEKLDLSNPMLVL